MNRQIVLSSHPTGMPMQENFKLKISSIPSLNEGEVLIQSLYLSVDPYMRGRLGGRPSSHPPIALGTCMNGDGLGRVLQSKNHLFQVGDLVAGYLDWADYTVSKGARIEPALLGSLPITSALYPLGMTGMTAYFGFTALCEAKKGDTLVISGAAGAVGMLVGQMGKIYGCHVVGISGSDKKAECLKTEFGFDASLNYKKETFEQDLARACPKGVDIYFDNVGGDLTDTVLKFLSRKARIVLSGQIATYNAQLPDFGLRHFRTLIVKSATAKGFLVWDYQDRFPEAVEQMTQWIHEGKMKWKETILDGLENLPKAFLGLFSGDNLGKQLVKIRD